MAALSLPAYAQWTSVGTGIEYQKFRTTHPNDVYVARMLLTESNAYLESSMGQGKISCCTETVGSQAARYDDAIGFWNQVWGNRNDVIIAINGSFYDTSTGVPTCGMVHSGWYCQRYCDVGGESGFDWSLNRNFFIGDCISHYPWKQLITYVSDGNITQEFQGINVAPAINQLTLFTPQFDTNTKTDNTVSEVLVEMSRPAMLMPTPAMVTGVVKQVRPNAGSTPIQFDQVVLSAKGSAATNLLAYAHVGDTIGISQEVHTYKTDCATQVGVDWTKAYGNVAGNFVFLRGGVNQPTTNSGMTARNPRTAIGYNANYIFFFVCDGRSTRSVGMTSTEMATFFINTLGATDAVNQDGGGSSTMIVNGVLKNIPSDGSQRAVSNGMLMCNLVPRVLSTALVPNDSVKTTTTANLLYGPGTNYATMTSLSANTQGTIVDHPLKGVAAKGTYWWKATFGANTGWVNQAQIVKFTPPTTCHVSSIVLSDVNAGAGTKNARATVTVKDNNGDPVANATVTGHFTGDIDETDSGTTDATGVAVITTTTAVKVTSISFTFCATNITHATLTYAPTADVVTCMSYPSCTAPSAPTSPQASPSALCAGECSTLSATPGSGGDTVEWFTTGCGGTPVTGGASPSVCPTATTTYYARTRNSTTGCVSATCASVQVSVSQSPATVGGPQFIFNYQTTTGLGGNVPAAGTGAWSIVSGGTGTFNPNNTTPNATFTHSGGVGPIVLRWTVSSPSCPASTADVTVTLTVPSDLDKDGDVGQVDYGLFHACFSGPAVPRDVTPTCQSADLDQDGDVDQDDFGIFQRCYGGEGNLVGPNCAN